MTTAYVRCLVLRMYFNYSHPNLHQPLSLSVFNGPIFSAFKKVEMIDQQLQ